MFLDVFDFCFSRVSCVDVCVIFMVNFVCVLVVLPEEGSNFLPKRSVFCWVFL
jgi:hypothetical protein